MATQYQRNIDIFQLRMRGETLQSIAETYGISSTRVRMICKALENYAVIEIRGGGPLADYVAEYRDRILAKRLSLRQGKDWNQT